MPWREKAVTLWSSSHTHTPLLLIRIHERHTFTNLAVVIFLSFIGEDGADHCAGVLDHHLPSLDVPLAEEASPMNLRPRGAYRGCEWFFWAFFILLVCCVALLASPVNAHCFFGDLLQVPESHCHGKFTASGSSVTQAASTCVFNFYFLPNLHISTCQSIMTPLP